MKPDWKDAPEWARWLAMNDDGVWHWYENAPELFWLAWSVGDGKVAIAGRNRDWDLTLEQRPGSE